MNERNFGFRLPTHLALRPLRWSLQHTGDSSLKTPPTDTLARVLGCLKVLTLEALLGGVPVSPTAQLFGRGKIHTQSSV